MHEAKELGKKVRVGPIASSDVFYNPDTRAVRPLVGPRHPRGRDGGSDAVHARRTTKIQTGCLLIVSDVVVEGEFVRISDEEMRRAVDEMTELALATATAEPKHAH